MFRIGICFVLALSATVSLSGQTRQSPLDRARDLYYQAAFIDALAALDGIDVTSSTDAATVELYRAACLFAVGRTSEAEAALERLVVLSPDVNPDQLDMAPWITLRFAEVRARLLSLQRASPLEEPEFYTVADSAVTRPVPIREDVPEPPTIKGIDFAGIVTVTVDIARDGSVERIDLEGSVHPIYARLLRDTTRNWRYQPATLNAQPVKFRKALSVEIR